MTTRQPLGLHANTPAAPRDGWVVIASPADRSDTMAFDPGMVGQGADGTVSLGLGAASSPWAAEPYAGSAIRSQASLVTGTFSWTAQAPRMVDGAVWGMFAYKQDYAGQPWLEFDFEFVGGNTRQVQLAVHMEDANGERITQVTDSVIDLGFDAARGMHDYEVVVLGDGVVFRVDGAAVAYFSAHDMPGEVWYTGALRSHVELWSVSQPQHVRWAGEWRDPGAPLVGTVAGATVRPGDVGGAMPLLGGAGADSLAGGAGRDVIDGLAGDDALTGRAGADRIQGGHGNDTIAFDAGDDWIDGGRGVDWLRAGGPAPVRVDLATTRAQDTGWGRDAVWNVENVAGGTGDDWLRGSSVANVLEGGGGNDRLMGLRGADTLVGGAGRDIMSGGVDADRDVFVFGSVTDSAPGAATRDRVTNFASGVDVIDLRGIDGNAGLAGNQALGWGDGTAAAFSAWSVASGNGRLLLVDVTGDARADFGVHVAGTGVLAMGDVLL